MLLNKFRLLIVLAFAAVLFFPSCRVLNPNIMLQTDKNFKFDTLPADSSLSKEYKLAPNDIIELRLFANDGFKLIDIISGLGTNAGANVMLRNGFEYVLDMNGIAKLPIIGNVNLKGMTIIQAQLHLEERYSEFYVKPFVLLQVINRRVIVFPGEPGAAKIVSIANNNTTVMEVLAAAGGISASGKAYNIKLIRKTNDPAHPKIYKLDLSRIEGIAQANLVVQSNDIIYVEPRRRLATQTLREITPILSLTTSLISFYFLLTRF